VVAEIKNTSSKPSALGMEFLGIQATMSRGHAPEAEEDLRALRGQCSPATIPLRVAEDRVSGDISRLTVEILAIVTKSKAEASLSRFGDPA
jgi:hypothetical protein